MKHGHLSQYFTGIASKKLSAVETDPKLSHQHEFNGVNNLIEILGPDGGATVHFKSRFVYLSDKLEEPLVAEGEAGWYDSRRNHATRSEYRLYYPSNAVMDSASAKDFLIVAKRPDNTLLFIIAESESTAENQIKWLFGLKDVKSRFLVKGEKETESIELNFTVRLILEQIGIEVEETAEDHLDELLSRFGSQFPKTREFSDYARDAFPEISPLEDPDQTIIEWMDREETLFRTLERHIVQDRLDAGFSDVDAFISFSLSVLNRRKSRAGHALENHLEAIFTAHNIRYDRGKETENRAKPDFVFPSIKEYRDKNFPENLLTMLGAKQTCKDRWRQVLSEAKRIELKHLFTLEPGISENQTEEMKSQKLQLVVPVPLIETYSKRQQGWLMNFREFLDVVKHRQEK